MAWWLTVWGMRMKKGLAGDHEVCAEQGMKVKEKTWFTSQTFAVFTASMRIYVALMVVGGHSGGPGSQGTAAYFCGRGMRLHRMIRHWARQNNPLLWGLNWRTQHL